MSLYFLHNMLIKGVLIVYILFAGNPIDGQTACTNDKFGENDPNSKDDNIDSNTDFGYMMNEPKYIVDCCGIVDRWDAVFDQVSGTRTIYFQVWRPTTGTTYELVGQNVMTVTGNGEQDIDIPQINRITVKANDRWGWWSSGTDIIKYKSGGGEEDNNYMMTLTAKTVADTQDWGSATIENGRSYAIRMDVLPNNDPEFTNLPDTVTIPATTASGTSVFTVSVYDIDKDDVSSLSVTMAANADYSFDATTYYSLETRLSYQPIIMETSIGHILNFITYTDMLTTGTTFTSSATDTITFTVEDQCGNTETRALTVLITNQPPVINNLPSSASIIEDETTQQLLHTLNVTDPEGSTITCSLAASAPTSSSFDVLPISISVYGIYSKSSPGFDYSTTSSYTLTIDCTDGEYTDSEAFIVIITQNTPPVFINLQNSTSVSTTDSIGSTAFTVLVDDTDDLTFSMTCSTTPCPFTIFDSGQIQISEDLSNHATVGYDLYISVSDGRNTVGPSILTITIADLNDPVSISNLPVTISVVENTIVGTSIFTVSYSDTDSSQSHTISMTSSPSVGLTYIGINSSTGIVTTSGAINYETIGTTTFTFDVTVSDPVVSDTKTMTIEIIDVNEAPTFSQSSYTLSTSEGTAGMVIGTPNFGITDPDSGDTAVLTNDCGSETGYFSMDSVTGQVSFQSNYDLDTGSLPATVSCTVTVKDSANLLDTATLVINIADDNDNTPVFSPTNYYFYISYYAKSGTVVGTITATDADAGTYGVIAYTLDQSSLAVEHFTISSSGEISVKETPEGSAMGYSTSVTITATASDVGGQSDTASIVIVVSDTTTTSTTTTTDRYLTFIEDPKNIAWLAVCLFLLLVAVCVLFYVAYTCHGEKGCARFCRNCRGRKRERFRLRQESFDSCKDKQRGGKYTRTNNFGLSVRPSPPAPELQAWRGRMK